jgi:hypothetical protein
MPTYRMYVDEVGNADYKSAANPNQRYLSLTGVIMDWDYVGDTVAPALEALKALHFGAHPDEPLVLHRRELVSGAPPFQALKNPIARDSFNQDLLQFLRDTRFRLITVVIDKQAMIDQYRVWRYNPYHYCMECLLERYVWDLNDAGTQGDVMAEARGKNEDKKLKGAYRAIVMRGSAFLPAQSFRCLKSRDIHFKRKESNIAGLQIADLLAYPSYRATLAAHLKQPVPGDFNGEVIAAIKPKYRRGPGVGGHVMGPPSAN